MQERRRFFKLFLVALIISLLLAGCTGGGSTGSTWFNLPSIPLQIGADGSASVLGFNIGPLLPADLLQKLQAANVQKLEVRIGYNGVHAYANGQDAPYLTWDEQSMGTLQGIIRGMSASIPNANLIADWLPWARKIGLGAALSLPSAQGQSAVAIPRWSGETAAKSEAAPEKPTIGPLHIGGLSFDEGGNASFAGVALSKLGAGVTLPPNIQDLFKSLGAEKLGIKTTPNGVQLSLNEKPLPSLAYDAASLNQVMQLLPAFGVDQNTLSTLQNVVPQLPGADVSVDVSLKGESGQTQIGNIPLKVNADGTLSAYGLPLGNSPLLPADVLSKLQQAKVQQLFVNVEGNSIILAANGQPLPTLSYDNASIDSLTKIAGAFGVPEQTVSTGLELVRNIVEQTPVGATINLGEGEATSATPDLTMKPADLKGMSAPTIHIDAGFDQNGALQTVGELATSDLAQVGVPLSFSLPPNVMDIFSKIGAKEIGLKSEPNKLNLTLDGKTAMSIGFDEASLKQALTLAKPFLGSTPLDNPDLTKLLDEQILPIAPAADLDIKLKLQ